MSLTLQAIKAKSEARNAEEKKLKDRKRNITVLVYSYLMDNGLVRTAEQLKNESQIPLNKYQLADNIALPDIIHEYEEYYQLKFDRKPVLVRSSAIQETPDDGLPTLPTLGNLTGLPSIPNQRNKRNNSSNNMNSSHRSSDKIKQPQPPKEERPNSTSALELVGMTPPQATNPIQNHNTPKVDKDDFRMKLTDFMKGLNDESRELALMISHDIFSQDPNVHWDDIIGLDDAKAIFREAVEMPIKYPQIFTGLLKPWHGMLLYGPPGTGKTMLAKAVATQCNTTFFNVTASTMVSKWRGDSEKLVRMLFDLAKMAAPSTIFIDEIDSILSQRGGGEGSSEHEASHRMKTELLIQMNGLAKSDSLVFVLAASNMPWILDQALLRRLDKKIYVPLPIKRARENMIRKLLSPYVKESDIDFDFIAEKTNGYSGSDIELVCREAVMRKGRLLMRKLDALERDSTLSFGNEYAKLEAVTMDDIDKALEVTKPTAMRDNDKFISWTNQFASNNIPDE